MYTPKQVSEMLRLPVSTLRRYSVDYSDVLSEAARGGGGKKRYYTEQDIVILKRLKEYVRERKTPDEVKQLLQLVDSEPKPTPEQASSLALIPAIAEEFERLNALIAQLVEDKQSQDERLRRLEETLEWQSLPLWKRLRKKRP